MTQETVLNLRQDAKLMQRVEAEQGKPPEGSLSACLRLDARISPDDFSVVIDLPHFAQRVFQADDLLKKLQRARAALEEIEDLCNSESKDWMRLVKIEKIVQKELGR